MSLKQHFLQTGMNWWMLMIVLICAFFSGKVEGSLVIGNQTFETATTPFYIHPESNTFGSPQFLITAPVVEYDPTKALNYTGKIVFIPVYSFSVDVLAESVYVQGAVGMIMQVTFFHTASFLMENFRSDFTFPCIEVLQETTDYLLELLQTSNETVIVTISDDPYESLHFDRVYREAVIINLVLVPVYLVIFFYLLSSFLLALVSKETEVRFNLKSVIAVFLITLNLMRLIYVCLDPISGYKLVNWKINAFCIVSNLILTLISMVIVTIFWLEELDLLTNEQPCIKNSKFMYYIVLLITLIALLSLFIGVVGDAYLIFYDMVIIIILSLIGLTLIIGIYHIIAASILARTINRIHKSDVHRNRSRKFLTKIIVISILELIIPIFYILNFLLQDEWVPIFLCAYFIVCGAESVGVSTILQWKKAVVTEGSTLENSKKNKDTGHVQSSNDES